MEEGDFGKNRLELENKALKILVGVVALIAVVLLILCLSFGAKYTSLQSECTEKLKGCLEQQQPFVNISIPFVVNDDTGEGINLSGERIELI